MSLHLELAERLRREFGPRLDGEPELRQDALILRAENGAELEIRYAGPAEYSFHWTWSEAELRIDTAPLHAALAGGPSHLHDAEGGVGPDPLTRAGAEPWDNVRAVLTAILADPLLRATGAGGA